jgi:hypothetical protein
MLELMIVSDVLLLICVYILYLSLGEIDARMDRMNRLMLKRK